MWSSRFTPYKPPPPPPDPLKLHAVQRDWETRWQALSPAARRAFLASIEDFRGFTPTGANFKPEKVSGVVALVNELSAAGFLRTDGRLRVADEACPFSGRLAFLDRSQILRDSARSKLHWYVSEFFPYQVYRELERKVPGQGFAFNLKWHLLQQEIETFCLPSRHWIGWVRKLLSANTSALALLDLLQLAPGPVPLADLGKLVPTRGPNNARKAHEVLFAHLVSFEDIDPETGAIQVGLLPGVRAALERQAHPPPRPALLPQPTPTVLAPEGGSDLVDLRAFLLELIARPARLRQGSDELYQKDIERLALVLEALAGELAPPGAATPEGRIQRVFRWAWFLNLALPNEGGDKRVFQITEDGQAWLQLSLALQFAYVAEQFREMQPAQSRVYYSGDSLFLHSSLTVFVGKSAPTKPEAQQAQRQALRQALYSAFRALPAGAFVRLDDFLAHATHGSHNPLFRGKTLTEVGIQEGYQRLPPLEEAIEQAGRTLLRQILQLRLVPLGAVRFGINAAGEQVIARTPRLDIYFGFQPDKKEAALVEEGGRPSAGLSCSRTSASSSSASTPRRRRICCPSANEPVAASIRVRCSCASPAKPCSAPSLRGCPARPFSSACRSTRRRHCRPTFSRRCAVGVPWWRRSTSHRRP